MAVSGHHNCSVVNSGGFSGRYVPSASTCSPTADHDGQQDLRGGLHLSTACPATPGQTATAMEHHLPGLLLQVSGGFPQRVPYPVMLGTLY